MSTSIASTLFGKTRLSVLRLLFGNPERSYYLREIAFTAKVGIGALQRELKKLSEAGIIRREASGRQVYFQIDKACPIYPELKSLLAKTAGWVEALQEALTDCAGRIAVAFVFGSFAVRKEANESDIDLLVIGDAGFPEVVAALETAQDVLDREINPVVYPVKEFKKHLLRGNHFVSSVMSAEKVFIIGTSNELAELAR